MQWNLQDKVDLKHLLKERDHFSFVSNRDDLFGVYLRENLSSKLIIYTAK